MDSLRLRIKEAEIKPKQLEGVLGISGAAVWKKLHGETQFSKQDAEKVSAAFNVRAEWLMFGTLPMRAPGNEVKEPEVRFSSFTLKAIGERFERIVNDYCKRYDLNKKEVAAQWHIDETHFSNVQNGNKDISIKIILAALQYGNVNLNYLMGGIGSFYIDSRDVNSELLALLKKHDSALSNIENTTYKKRA